MAPASISSNHAEMASLDDGLEALGAMSASELSEEWRKQMRTAAPRIPADLLRRALAQRLQERAFGGLPAVVLRQIKKAAAKSQQEPTRSKTPSIRPGTRLIREWNGRTIVVLTLEDGFSWDGRHYGSLTKIANEVAGGSWSGPRFFGLTHSA